MCTMISLAVSRLRLSEFGLGATRVLRRWRLDGEAGDCRKLWSRRVATNEVAPCRRLCVKVGTRRHRHFVHVHIMADAKRVQSDLMREGRRGDTELQYPSRPLCGTTSSVRALCTRTSGTLPSFRCGSRGLTTLYCLWGSKMSGGKATSNPSLRARLRSNSIMYGLRPRCR